VLVQQAGEISVHALVTADQLVREGQAWHKTSFFEPEDGAETSGEEDALDAGKSDESLGKSAVLSNPLKSPLGLLGDGGNGVDGGKEESLFGGVLNVGINQQRVSLRVDVLHHHLETVETTGLGDLDFCNESLGKVFQHNSVRSREKGQDVLNEVLLVVGELYPVSQVVGKIDFFCGPETGHLLLVHLPDIVVLDRENNEPVGVLLQEGLGKGDLGNLGLALLGGALTDGHLGGDSSVLAVVLLHKLGAHLADEGGLLEGLLALAGLGFLLFLAELLVLGEDVRNFLVVGSHMV